MIAAAVMVAAALVAADPTAVLVSERAPDALAACPDAPALTALVMRRLGRDPFDPLAARKAFVRFERKRSFVAVVRVREPDGREGTRTLGDRSCQALAEQVALALAVAIDPLGLDRPHFVRPAWAVRPAEADETFRRRRAAPAPTPAPRPPPPDHWALAGGPSLGVRLGFAPSVMLGVGVDAGFVRRDWRLALRAETLFSSPGEAGASLVAASSAGLALGACYRALPLEACVRVGITSWTIAASEGLTVPVEATRLLGFGALAATLAAGPRAYVGVELLVPLPRPVLVVDGADVWRAWPVVLALTVGARLGATP